LLLGALWLFSLHLHNSDSFQAIEGNIEAVAAHTKGLDVLIQLNGGLEVLDHMVLSKIYQYVATLVVISLKWVSS
jgi:hypothetical protein